MIAIERKTRRFRTSRENYGRRLKIADSMITTHSAELDRLQDRVSTLDRDLQRASQHVRTATSQRDQARIDRNATRDLVSATRDTITRLEKRINQAEKSQKSRQDLELAHAALQQERDGLVVQRDELFGQLGERFMEVTDLRAERDQAQERLSNIVSLLPSTLGPFPAAALSQGPTSRSSIEVLSDVAAGQKAEEPVSSPSFAGLPDHLPRSTRSPTQDGSGNASFPPATSESLSDELSHGRDQFGIPSGPLSDAELADLPPTTVPRSEWIPGYHAHCNFHGHDIVPRSAQDIRQTSIVEMDADLLFHHFAKPMQWLIPLRLRLEAGETI
ncbi:hypothetical protein F443_01351 [Phytophthora nicotianae P1569]|uniref:Uncharacterized protein n=1 Tax=Phytophthora nicotianae P1569 TaxID=1317065 RepID=V9FZ23_PHYNI|nr:hypothetical protein F443_01351 [Phytophthora nicotianae P1569]